MLVIDGEPVPYALARIPPDDDHRGNLAAGARAGPRRSTTATAGSSRSRPGAARRGMLFVGLDVIGGYVTEINVTSPTGIRELDKQFGTDIAGLLMDAIQKRL